MTGEKKILKILQYLGYSESVAELIQKHKKLLLYTLIGGVAVLLDLTLFTLLAAMTPLHILVINTISVFSAMIYSFVVNAKINFKISDQMMKRFVIFTIVTGVGYSISSLMLTLGSLVELNPILVKVTSLPLVLIVQFSLNSKITFSDNISSKVPGGQ